MKKNESLGQKNESSGVFKAKKKKKKRVAEC